MDVATEARDWITSKEATRILGVREPAVIKLGNDRHITVRRLPGCVPRYLRSDVERLAIESTRPAKCGAGEAIGIPGTP